jgi:hypothetical protein
MMRTTIAMAAGLALAATLPVISAHATARDRVFVASYGSDANPCTFGSPCKTFQNAVNVVAPGGEVTAIDSAGFGPIAINKSVTITSPAGIEAGVVPVAGGDAIDINAGPTDVIVLRSLTLNGSGIGYNGIVFDAGASLTVSDCVVENFNYTGSGSTTGNGILMQPTSGTVSFTITNSTFSNNGNVGLSYSPPAGSTATANGVINYVVAADNGDGIDVNTGSGGGSTAVGIANSVTSNNSQHGIYLQNNNALKVSIDNSIASSNSYGIFAFNTVNVTLGRSVITANSQYGIDNLTSPNTFNSYGDNRINGNDNDFTGPALAPYALN